MTPLWICAIIIALFIALTVIESCCAANSAFDRDIKERLRCGKPVFCMYRVDTVQGEKTLACGTKYRVMGDDLVQEGMYRRPFKKIYVYVRTVELCGVECKVTYYVGDEPNEEMLCITAEGRRLFEGREAIIRPNSNENT